MKSNKKIICQNKKAHHEYFIEDIYQCGIVLHGTEIKSIRNAMRMRGLGLNFKTLKTPLKLVEFYLRFMF